MNGKQLSAAAWICIAALSVIWGGSFLSVSVALREVPTITAVAHRVVWAAIALWIVALVRGERPPRDLRIWAALAVMGFLNNLAPFLLQAWSLSRIETGLVGILNATTAIWGICLAALFLADERLTPLRLAGVAVGFLGVAFAIGIENLASFDPRSLAQIAVILSTLSYALAGVWARKTLSGLSPVIAAAGMLTGSSIGILPVAIAVDGLPTLTLAPSTLWAIGYYAVAATALAYLLYYRILALAGAGNLMIVTLTVAPVAILLGAATLGEALPARAHAGFALLAAGLLLIDGRVFRWKTRRRPDTTAP